MATKKSGLNKKNTQKRAKSTSKKRRKAASGATMNGMAPHPRMRHQVMEDATLSLPENFHALYDHGFRASRGIPLEDVEPQPTEGHRRMAKEVRGLEVQYDPVTQLPNFIVRPRQATRSAERTATVPDQAVKKFLEDHGDLWNLSSADVSTIEVVSTSQPQDRRSAEPEAARGRARSRSRSGSGSPFNLGNLKAVNLVQRIEGREVFNSDVTVALDSNNEVISVSGQFFPGAGATNTRARARGANTAQNIASPEDAIARAIFDLINVNYKASEFKLAPARSNNGHYRYYEHRRKPNDDRPEIERPVRVKDVMFPLGNEKTVVGYYLELWVKTYPVYSYVMDAIDTPDVLYRRKLSEHVAFAYRVHNTGDALKRPHDGPAPGTPHPTGKPDGFQARIVKEKLISIDSLLPGDHWLPDEATTTDGNNCIAYADLKPADGLGNGDVKGTVTAPRIFDYTYNHLKPASDPNNLQNSLVGMFFNVNWVHDRWYQAGFDEASGNAQKNNFGRGGIEGDPILAEGNDFSGTDNANMATPADGESPRMQMFEFKGPTPLPSRTSNLETLIVVHEMAHYLTNRLVGNANGLSNRQGEAMGEGWGDFLSLCMTSQKTDNFSTGVFAVGGWTDLTPNFKQNYYFSIRRYPYSADMSKNPLTFKHISNNVVLPAGPPINANPFGNNEVHNAGEYWCIALWEVFVNLVLKLGHEEAEKRMLAYVIGGLKQTPIRPTFTQARDAIVRAVTVMAPGDLPEVKRGFAKRGMGAGAVSPPSNSTSFAGVVESFVP